MEADHHHTPHMGLGQWAFNRFARACDLSARKRPIWAICATYSATLAGGCPVARAGQLTIAGRVPKSWSMMVHADHFRFILLNRPFPRAV